MRSSRRPVILVTGFGPFPGQPVNASGRLAELLADAAASRLLGYDVRAAVLPTEWQAGLDTLRALLDEARPVVAVHFGVAAKLKGFAIEMRGSNAARALPDASGVCHGADCLAGDAPTELAASLPVGLIVARLRRMGIPVQQSRDAGRYLCNAALFTSLDHARGHQISGVISRRGFVHIPAELVGGGIGGSDQRPGCPLDWEMAVRGGLAIIATALGPAGQSLIQ